MKKEEYVESLIIDDKIVEVGQDDYGQCYFFEYRGENNETKIACCGSYNPLYKEEIADFFGVDVNEIKSFNKYDLENKTRELNKETKMIEEKRKTINALKQDTAIYSMLKNSYLVGRCFKKGDIYYKVLTAFGCREDYVYCFCLNLNEKIIHIDRTDSYCHTNLYSDIYFGDFVNVTPISIKQLGTEISIEEFDKQIEVMDKNFLEAMNTANSKVKEEYSAELAKFGNEG